MSRDGEKTKLERKQKKKVLKPKSKIWPIGNPACTGRMYTMKRIKVHCLAFGPLQHGLWINLAISCHMLMQIINTNVQLAVIPGDATKF